MTDFRRAILWMFLAGIVLQSTIFSFGSIVCTHSTGESRLETAYQQLACHQGQSTTTGTSIGGGPSCVDQQIGAAVTSAQLTDFRGIESFLVLEACGFVPFDAIASDVAAFHFVRAALMDDALSESYHAALATIIILV